MERYKKILLNSQRVSGNSGHLDFWRVHTSSFPILSKIARELLSIPSSSVLSERTFSRATALYRNKNRTRMHSEKGEWTILVGANRNNKIRFFFLF